MSRSIRQSTRMVTLALAVLAPPGLAQQAAEPERERPEAPAEPARPAPAPAPANRDFKPSESVSPDQEVDFPADI